MNELSCFDTTTDSILAGQMTTLIEWLPEYSNEVILPHQMMKNSCYKLVLVQTALRNFICCLIFLLASSAGTIVWLEEQKKEKKHTKGWKPKLSSWIACRHSSTSGKVHLCVCLDALCMYFRCIYCMCMLVYVWAAQVCILNVKWSFCPSHWHWRACTPLISAFMENSAQLYLVIAG